MNTINIGHIIKNSDSKFLKNLPDFVIRIITIIFRQDDLNNLKILKIKLQGR